MALKTSKEAKAYIKELKKQLEDKGLLENVDTLALLMVEVSYDTYLKATEYLLENGTTYNTTSREGDIIPKDFPQVKIQRDAQIQLTKLLQEFGGTASSRKRVKDASVIVDNSPLAKFMNAEKR